VEISPKIGEIPTKLKNTSSDNTKEPEIQSIAEVSQETELELLKTIQKLKGELAEKDKQITSLTDENERLKIISQEQDRKLKGLQEKIKELTKENYSILKNVAENISKNQANNKRIKIKHLREKVITENSPNTLLKIKEKLTAEIQVSS